MMAVREGHPEPMRLPWQVGKRHAGKVPVTDAADITVAWFYSEGKARKAVEAINSAAAGIPGERQETEP